jgi:hypothetical protein
MPAYEFTPQVTQIIVRRAFAPCVQKTTPDWQWPTPWRVAAFATEDHF